MNLKPAEQWAKESIEHKLGFVHQDLLIPIYRQIQANTLRWAAQQCSDHGDMAKGQILNGANQLDPKEAKQ